MKPIRSRLVRTLVLFAVAAWPGLALAAYVFTSIDYPNAVFTDVRGINNVGQVNGYASDGNSSFPFVYNAGTYTPLPPSPGNVYLGASGINDLGTITGNSATYSGGVETATQGLIFSGGAYTFFSKPGFAFTNGRAIGPTGLITGYAENAPRFTGTSVGFIYNPGTQVYTDIVIPGSWLVIAQGINAAGQVVGSANGVPGGTSAFLREANGTITTFRINDNPTRARGINDNGLITGFTTVAGKDVAYVGDSNGYQIIDPPGSISSYGQAINNLGQVAGLWTDAGGKTHGFIATPAVLPTGTTGGGGYTYSTAVVPSTPIVIDPVVAIGYDYAVGAGDPLFKSVRLPIGIGNSNFILKVGAQRFPIGGGELFDFTANGFTGGVSAFTVEDIKASALLDPTNQQAFATEVEFTGAGAFTGTQTPLPATLFTVTNNNDSGPGSLRQAILDGNNETGPVVIDFAPNVTGTIQLTSGQIQITHGPLTIVGPGRDVLSIDGNANNRIFRIIDPAELACPSLTGPDDYLVTISGLTLFNASRNTDDSAGAINSYKSLALDNVRIRDNKAKAGGGVQFLLQHPGQSLTIANSEFLDNFALPLVSPTTGTTSGGALRIVENCAGTRTPATIGISGTRFQGNRAQPVALWGLGGAIFAFAPAGDITITDSAFVENQVAIPVPPVGGALYRGGAIHGTAKSLTLVRSEISQGTADIGAGISLFNDADDLQAPASAMAVKLVNSTVSSNAAAGTGGAMFLFGNVAVEIANSTIAENSADPTRTGGIVVSTGATSPPSAGSAAAPTLKLVSSILANNSSDGGDVATNFALIPAYTVDATKSLVETVCPVCSITVTGVDNLVGADAMLGPLSLSGGSTRTHALMPGSPAIDTGSNPLGLTTDQRYPLFARTVGAGTDMGAWEANGATAPVLLAAWTRHEHGAAGDFDLPLSLNPGNPTTEPRQGPAVQLVLQFDKPIVGGQGQVTEGTATIGNGKNAGNVVALKIADVVNEQFVTFSFTELASSDGGVGGSASVRIGFLFGDVNGSRGVSVADKFLVNNVLAQGTTAANFLRDINLSGSVTLADLLLVNNKQATALPPLLP